MKKFVNILTISRLLATFLLPFVWNYLRPLYILIFVALVLITDFLDGLLARKFHVQSLFGTIMDVVADKVFGIIIIIIVATHLPIFYIPLLLEIGIALINFSAAFLGATTKSSFLGKTKMWFLGSAIVLGIISIFGDDIQSFINISFMNVIYANIDMFILCSVFITAGAELMVITDYSRHIIKELKAKKTKLKYEFKSKEDLKVALFDTEYCLKHKDQPISKSLLK